jgi:hypothetical protein
LASTSSPCSRAWRAVLPWEICTYTWKAKHTLSQLARKPNRKPKPLEFACLPTLPSTHHYHYQTTPALPAALNRCHSTAPVLETPTYPRNTLSPPPHKHMIAILWSQK